MMMKYTAADDIFFCEEIKEHFSDIGGLKLRESEGTMYVNFSNLVKVTHVSNNKPDRGIKVGDLLLVHHRVQDNRLYSNAGDYCLVAYSEDIVAMHDSGTDVVIDNFKPCEGYRITDETYEILNGIEAVRKVATTYSIDIHSGELLEYRPNADYEVFLNGNRNFIIKESDLVNEENTSVYHSNMICTSSRIEYSQLTGMKYIFNNDILGYVTK